MVSFSRSRLILYRRPVKPPAAYSKSHGYYVLVDETRVNTVDARRASKQRNPTYRRDCRLPSDVNPGGFVNATAFTARLWIHTDVLSLSQLLCSSLIPRWAHYTHHSMMSGLLGVTTSLHLRIISHPYTSIVHELLFSIVGIR